MVHTLKKVHNFKTLIAVSQNHTDLPAGKQHIIIYSQYAKKVISGFKLNENLERSQYLFP